MPVFTTLVLSALAVVLASCTSEEPTSPPGSSPLYVHAVNGSHVIYDNYRVIIDERGWIIGGDFLADDSCIVVKSKAGVQVDSVTSTQLPFHSAETQVFVNNLPSDTVTLSQLGGKITQSLRLRYEIASLELDLGRRNVMICDLNNSTWIALNDTVVPFDLAGPPQCRVSGALNFTGKSLGDSIVKFNDQKILVKKSQIALNATFYISAGSSQYVLPVKLVREYWIAEKIGVVKMFQVGRVIDLGSFGTLLGAKLQIVPGLTKTAKSWSTR
jgi:hypothetical protein